MIRRILITLGLSTALVPASFAQDLEGLRTTNIENAKMDAEQIVLRLGFTFASAVVPETVRMRLDRTAQQLLDEYGSAKIEVAGHTDGAGPEAYNQRLSEERAASVKQFLVERGVPAERISVVGYGESQPRAGNDTVEGRRLNRRVEVKTVP
jgi:OOP family OmpA-OmpF porin